MNRKSHLFFAFKIYDGLFIGDFNSLRERDFLMQNKITHIINCAYPQLQPMNLGLPITYLELQWYDSDDQIIIDASGDNLQRVSEFIDGANGEAVLICSQRGQSRSLTILTAYMMEHFEWSLYKTLEYMNSKRQDFEIRASFLSQLIEFDKRLKNQLGAAYSKSWSDQQRTQEQVLLQNTFNNSQLGLVKGPVKDIKNQSIEVSMKKNIITWSPQLATICGQLRTDTNVQPRPEPRIRSMTPTMPEPAEQRPFRSATPQMTPMDRLLQMRPQQSQKQQQHRIVRKFEQPKVKPEPMQKYQPYLKTSLERVQIHLRSKSLQVQQGYEPFQMESSARRRVMTQAPYQQYLDQSLVMRFRNQDQQSSTRRTQSQMTKRPNALLKPAHQRSISQYQKTRS